VCVFCMSHGTRLKTWSAGAAASRRVSVKAHLRRGSKSVDSSTMVADALMSELKYQMRSAQHRHLRVRNVTFSLSPSSSALPSFVIINKQQLYE